MMYYFELDRSHQTFKSGRGTGDPGDQTQSCDSQPRPEQQQPEQWSQENCSNPTVVVQYSGNLVVYFGTHVLKKSNYSQEVR